MTTIASHDGSTAGHGFVDSTHYVGTITLDATVGSLVRQVGLTLAYYLGDLTGATIAFSGTLPTGGYYPASGPFTAGAVYGLATDAAHPVTYTITLAVPASGALIMAARASAYYVSHVGSTYSSLGTTFTQTVTDANWTAGDQLALLIESYELGNPHGNPTVPAGFALIESLGTGIIGSGYTREIRVYAKPYAGESSITYSVPSGWAHGGFLYDQRWGGYVVTIRGASGPATGASSDSAISPAAPTASITDGLALGWLVGGTGTKTGWINRANLGGFFSLNDRSTVVGTMTSAPAGPVAAALGFPSDVDELLTGDIPAAGGWRVGAIHMGDTGQGW